MSVKSSTLSGAARWRAQRRSTAELLTPEVQREVNGAGEYSFPGLQIRFQANGATLFLAGPALIAATEIQARRELINRLFSISALRSLRLNTRKGEARLDFLKEEAEPLRLAKLARALQAPRPPALVLPHEELILQSPAPDLLRITRHGADLTLWSVDAPTNGFYRLSHPSLRQEFIRRHILDELATLPDVAPRTIYFPLWGRDSLIVFVRPHHVDATVFPEVLDPVLTRCLYAAPAQRLPSIRSLAVNANLALAPISDFLFPPLRIVSAGFLGSLGAANLPRALAGLRQGKLTLELLSTIVAALALITAEFFPAAIMYWLMKFWPQRASALYHLHHSRFIARYQLRPRRVWTDRQGVSMETRVEDLPPSSIVILTAGDIVPGDGVIVEGEAQIDERPLTGNDEDQTRSAGSWIYASTRIVEGSVRMKIAALGADTAAGRIAQWHRQALQRRDFESRTVPRAEKMVLPTLLVSSFAFLHGGLPVAKATLRPDYATGPAVAETLGSLATIIRAAQRGILLAGNAPLEKLSGPACVVFDDSVPWNRPAEGSPPFADLARSRGLTELVFFGRSSEHETESTATALGFDLFAANASAAAKRAYIIRQQKEGRVVIYVGNPVSEKEAAEQADVAISVLEPPFVHLEQATLALLSRDLWKFLELRALATDALKENRTAFNINMVPNLAVVLASFFFASPLYASVLMTNLGTATNYLVSEAKLHLAGTESSTR